MLCITYLISEFSCASLKRRIESDICEGCPSDANWSAVAVMRSESEILRGNYEHVQVSS